MKMVENLSQNKKFLFLVSEMPSDFTKVIAFWFGTSVRLRK